MPEYNLIIDLDNTMICSIKIALHVSNLIDVDKMIYHPNFIYYLNCNDCVYLVFARPKLKEFLEDAFKNFNLYVFTLANRLYAEPIVKKLEELYQVKFQNIWTYDDLEIDEITNKKCKCMCVTNLDNNKTFIMDDNTTVWINHIDHEIKLIKINAFLGHHNVSYIKENNEELIKIKDLDVNNSLMEDMIIYLEYLKKLINNKFTTV